jgi:PEP-CTERM motif
MIKSNLRALVAAACVGLASQAHAAIDATLSFIDPVGTVAADQDIEIWLRLSLSEASDALSFDSTAQPFEPPSLDLPLPTQGEYFAPDSSGTSDFTAITGAFLNTYYVCNHDFAVVCGEAGSAYSFDFWLNSEPGKPSVNFQTTFDLAPGQSFDFLLGTFKPNGGAAAPGVYFFYDAGVTLSLTGPDALGRELSTTWGDIASTCPSGESSCAFTRTVTPVPEPGAAVLMGLGLISAIGLARRRRRG